MALLSQQSHNKNNEWAHSSTLKQSCHDRLKERRQHQLRKVPEQSKLVNRQDEGRWCVHADATLVPAPGLLKRVEERTDDEEDKEFVENKAKGALSDWD